MLFLRNKLRTFVISGFVLTLIACSQEGSLTSQIKEFDPYNYIVQPGDTLYSIAWRYDLNYKDIAHWNNIKYPYLIRPTQRLLMRGPVADKEQKDYLFAAAPEAEVESEPAPDYSDPENIPPAPPLVSAQLSAPKANVQNNKAPVYRQPKTMPKKQSQPASKTTARSSQVVPASVNKNTQWIWPVRGKVISTFSANDNDRKGIDIQTVNEIKVQAAADGVVVYSGSGLISYGNLIIVKHNDRYLSAYAYNKKLLVKEGARVKSGQEIAIIGKNAKVTNLLHFEIRKDGKPVNPLVYLPKS